jgi:hypothetical protein
MASVAAEVVRGMSPETLAAVIGGVAGGVVGGVLGIVGVVLGLLVQRFLQRTGAVQHRIGEGDWFVARSTSTEVEERRLRVAFLNRKYVPVTVWGMRVEFSRGGEPLEDWARPHVQRVEQDGSISELSPVTLPPHILVPLVIRVIPEGFPQGTDQERTARLRKLQEADSAEFVATLIGARDKREKLKEPWRPLQRPQERP